MRNLLIFMSCGLFLVSCIPGNRGEIVISTPMNLDPISIAQVAVVNNQLILQGSGLSKVKSLKINNVNLNEELLVESATSTQLMANASRTFSIGVEQAFNLILNTVQGAATFPMTFSLDDRSVLPIKLSVTGATANQVLKADGVGGLAWGSLIPATVGSAALPSYSFVGNTNTGIYSSATNQIDISTNGVQRVSISDVGNIGLGISPSSGVRLLTKFSGSNSTNIESRMSAPHTTSFARAVLGIMDNLGATAATTGRIVGVEGQAMNAVPLTSVTKTIGVDGASYTTLVANVTHAIGVRGWIMGINSGTTITNGYGGYFETTTLAGNSNAISNAFGVYIGNIDGSTNKFSLYASDATAPSYFAGKLGVGVSPVYKLDVDGDINTTTCFRIGATTVSGVCTSDERLKENVKDFTPGLKALLGIRVRSYQFNGLGEMPKTGEIGVGVIAQELEKTNPGLIKTKLVKMRPEDTEKTKVKVVDYSKFSFMTINAVKELSSEADLLKLKIAKLEMMNNELRDAFCENGRKHKICK